LYEPMTTTITVAKVISGLRGSRKEGEMALKALM